MIDHHPPVPRAALVLARRSMTACVRAGGCALVRPLVGIMGALGLSVLGLVLGAGCAGCAGTGEPGGAPRGRA